MKVVLDTNVLLSGLMFPKSVPGQIVAAWREARFDLVLGREQLVEIGRVLAYRKIRTVLKWNDDTIGIFLKQWVLRAEMVEPGPTPSSPPRDPGDSHILATLIAAQGDFLVTGDGDLLALRHHYPILQPAEFVKML